MISTASMKYFSIAYNLFSVLLMYPIRMVRNGGTFRMKCHPNGSWISTAYNMASVTALVGTIYTGLFFASVIFLTKNLPTTEKIVSWALIGLAQYFAMFKIIHIKQSHVVPWLFYSYLDVNDWCGKLVVLKYGRRYLTSLL